MCKKKSGRILALLLAYILGMISGCALLLGVQHCTADSTADMDSAVISDTGDTHPDGETRPVSSADSVEVTSSADASEEADADFFSNAAFVGDSLMVGLRNYGMINGVFTESTFLCRSKFSVNNSITNSMSLPYQGVEYTLEDAVNACGADKVLIMLGMNDIAYFGIEETMEGWEVMTSRIIEKNPDVEIYILSCTPAYIGGEKPFSNELIDSYNMELESFALENEMHYIDVASGLKNEQGGLIEDYCSDEYVHLTLNGYTLVVDALNAYMASR